MEQSLRDRLGFAVTDHEVKFYGYCRTCLSKGMPVKKRTGAAKDPGLKDKYNKEERV